MTTLRSGAGQVPAPRIQVSARALAIALAAALAVALTALVLVLATSSGGGSTEPVRVAPTSGPIPPSPAERHQKPGLDGPGMRP